MSASRYRIGFITLEAINSYTTQLWLGVNDCAAHLDLNIITYGGFQKSVSDSFSNEKPDGKSQIDPLTRLIDVRSLDGVIIWTAGILRDHTYAKQFLSPYEGVPMVSIGVDVEGIHRVLIDGYQGMVDIATHLITHCGRRNLAFITGTPTNIDAQNRLQAYKDTLQRYGLPHRDEYIVPGAFAWNSREIGRKAVIELLDGRGIRPDAIVAASDDLAIGALELVRQRGIRVPEEMSITGFDDIPDCTSVYPALTTVSQSTYELAWRGVEMLLARIQGKATEERIVIPTHLVIRQSCGSHLFRQTTIQRSEDKPSDNPENGKGIEAKPTLPEYLAAAKAGFQAIFEETCANSSFEKIEELYHAFQWSVMLAEPSHFFNAIQNLIYIAKKREALEKMMNRLLTFTTRMCEDMVLTRIEVTAPYDRGLLITSLDLMTTKLNLLKEQALGAMEREQHAHDQDQLAQLQIVNRSLLTPYEPARLAEIFAQQLPQLGIDLAYVALFTSFDQPTDEVRLIVAYDRQKNMIESSQDRFFKVSQLSAGTSILEGRQMNLLLIPIYSTNLYAGFILFSFGPRNYQFYTQLSSTLSYNIVNSILLEQVRTHANQMEERVAQRTLALVAANQRLQSEISERIRIESELEVARDQALEVSRLKSEFLATMSHEIRTPMNGILGMTELLLEGELDDEQHSYAQVVHEEGIKLLEIINSILDFSKIEAGKVSIEELEFSLADEIQSVIKLLNPKAKGKGLTLLSAIAPNVPEPIISDPVRIGQILRNLVGNAIKFTESGEVFVTVQCDFNESATRSASGEEIQLLLQLTVRDTGIGMSRATIENLFTPFSQADSSTTRRYGGTGLGLAITKRLVDLLGGTITVESEPNVGSTFTVNLKCRCRHEVYQAALQKLTPQVTQFLLVSSDPGICRQLASYLDTWTIRASSYTEAELSNVVLLLHLYQKISHGVRYMGVVIDQQNSAIEPRTFARSIYADPLLKQCELLLISSNQSASFRQQVLDAGFKGILHPPITQSALHQHIMHFLPRPYAGLLGCDETQTAQVAIVDPLNRGKLILLVEDYINNQRVTLAYLRKLGYAAHVVEDGQAAVDAILSQGHLYQLVLMDWNLPILDGLQATEAIREHEKQNHQHIPIVGMTANALKGDRERCLAAGMDDYISKPVQREELGRVLNRWLVESPPS
ncbi:MAG: substrate-binding domain-containing protein [Caldilineaceae bacterium]